MKRRDTAAAASTYVASTAAAEAASRAATPVAAAAIQTISPNSMPNIEAKPARLPWARLRAVTYNTPGPGETVSRKVARAKRRTVVAAGIALMMMLDRDFLGRWAIDPPGSRFRDQKDERPTALVFLLRACAYQRYQRPPDDPRKTNPSAHRIRPISSTIHKICSDEERRPPPPKSRRRRTRTIRAATICIPPCY